MANLSTSIQSFFEHSQDLLFLIDLAGKIRSINPAVTSMSGWSESDLVSTSFLEWIHPEDIQSAQSPLAELKENRTPISIDLRIRCADDSYRWIHWSAHLDSDDQTVCSIARDIHQQKEEWEERRKQQSAYDAIIHSQSEMICRYNPEGILTFVNDAYCKSFGLSHEELIGKSIHDLVPEDKRVESESELKSRVENPRIVRHCIEITLPDSSIGYREWIDTPIFNDSQDLVAYQGVGRDITEQVRTEEAFRAVMEHSVQGFAIVQDAKYVFLNSKYAEISGYAISEMLMERADAFIDRIHPDDRKIVKQRHYDRLAGKPVPNNYEFRRFTKEGKLHWVEIHASLVKWKGRPAIQIAMVDVTKKKNAEIALAQNEGLLRTITETIPDYICVVDREGKFVYVNRLAEGVKEEQVLGSSFLKWIPPKYHLVAQRSLNQAIETNSVVEFEVEGYGRPGESFWYHSRISPFLDQKDVQHLVISSHNITQRKVQEHELLENRERLELALNGADLGLWDWNIETGEVNSNPRRAEMIGYQPGELAPTFEAWKGLVHPDDLPEVLRNLERHLEGKTLTYEAQYRMTTREGEVRWILDRGKVVERGESGEPLRASGTLLDITEKKEFEEKILQTQKLESLGVLAGGIAHDFNNLLMGILGNADLALIDCPPDSIHKEYIEDIIKASQHAADLCNQMLAYAGKGRFTLQQIDLSKLVREMAHLLEVSISKRINIEYNLHEGLSTFEGDPTQIRQVIMNLITNASDSMEDSNGTITLRTGVRHRSEIVLKNSFFQSDSETGEYVFFEVGDTGEGMPALTLEKIFDPFFTTKFKGRGLGLAAVLGIVRSHDGAIDVDTQEGKGTQFTLYFPTVHATPRAETRTLDSLSDWEGKGAVLLVDDEEAIRNTGKRILERKGFEVILAADGRECVQKFSEHRNKIFAVILDLTMPVMSGEEAYRELSKIDPNVRVILSSGYSENDATGRFVGQGLTGFIQKPYRPTDLAEKIREVMEEGLPSESQGFSA